MIWSSNIISEEQKEVYDENEKVAELFCGDLYVVRLLSGGICGDRDRGFMPMRGSIRSMPVMYFRLPQKYPSMAWKCRLGISG